MLQRGGARAGGKSDSKEQSQSSRQTVAIQAGGHTGCQARPHLPQPVPPPQRTAPPPGHTHAPEAELGVCCKAAAGGEHDDRWRHEGVLRRKGDLACRQTMGQAGRHWGAFRQWWRGGLMVEASHARAALCKAAEQLRQLRQAGRQASLAAGTRRGRRLLQSLCQQPPPGNSATPEDCWVLGAR